MQIKTNLTQRDFINVNFVLLWKKRSLRVVFVVMLIATIYSAYWRYSYKKVFPLDSLVWPVILVVFMIGMTLLGAVLNYRSNARIKETIEYNFGDDFLDVKGESFTSHLTWDKIYKVTKTKNWLLVWQSRQTANVIPLKDVWAGDVTKLKEILDNHGVKNNL